MKPLCMVCFLAGLMVVASVDTIPDPPAVSSQSPNVASAIRDARGVSEWRLSFQVACAFSEFQRRWIASTSTDEPILAPVRIVLQGYASDSSPPAFHT
jgi:hypothetical protein